MKLILKLKIKLKSLYILIFEIFQDIVDLPIFFKKGIPFRIINPNRIFSPNRKVYFFNYVRGGLCQKKLLLKYADLNKNSKILDCGCGAGKLAYSLKNFFDTGSYYGFDIEKKTINFLKKNHKKFNFNYHNLYYLKNKSKNDAAQINFNYENKMFDIICTFSIFTHQPTEVLENYLKQFSNMIKPGGITFNTFYIVDKNKKDKIKDQYNLYGHKINLNVSNNKYYTSKKENDFEKELDLIHHDIYYDKNYLLDTFEKYNFSLIKEDYGMLSGKKSEYGTQDFLVHKRN